MESNGRCEFDWLVQLRARGAFSVDRHVCVVRCFGSRRSRNGRGRLDSRGLAAGWGRRDGNWHLVHALHWDAGVRPAASRGLPLADRSAVTAGGHSRFGRCPRRGKPTEKETEPNLKMLTRRLVLGPIFLAASALLLTGSEGVDHGQPSTRFSNVFADSGGGQDRSLQAPAGRKKYGTPVLKIC